TFKTEGFIKITVLYDFFPKKLKYLVDIISMILALVYSSILLYYVCIKVYTSFKTEGSSLYIIETPLYILESVIVLGLISFIVQILLEFFLMIIKKTYNTNL